jgi:hypothetical protein
LAIVALRRWAVPHEQTRILSTGKAAQLSHYTFFVAAPRLIAVVWAIATAVAHGQAQPQKASDEAIVIVGCLVQAPPPNVDEFHVRTPALAVPAGTQVAVGGSPSSGDRATTSAGAPAGTTAYRITGLKSADLKPHVGHRVELRGKLSQNTRPPTKVTTTQDQKTGRVTTTVNEDWSIAGVLEATAVKMIATTCE